MVTEELIEQELAEARSYTAALAESESLQGLHVRIEIQLGLAGEQILGVVESQAVDLFLPTSCTHLRQHACNEVSLETLKTLVLGA